MPLLAVGADFSFTWPSAGELVAAGVREVYFYCGPALPPGNVIDSWANAGLGLVAIFETFSEQAQSDRPTGQANARYLRARMASVGYPRILGAYVMSDGSAGVPSGSLETITNYAGGVGDIEQQEYVGYGNEDAVAAAQRGSAFCTIDWIPITWTSRKDQGMRQLVGPVPINGIDLNHRFVPLPGQTVEQPKPKGPTKTMWVALLKTIYGVFAMKVGGFAKIADLGGDPTAYGPQEAVDLIQAGFGWSVVTLDQWNLIKANGVASADGGVTTGGAALTESQITAAVRAGMHGVPITGTVG